NPGARMLVRGRDNVVKPAPEAAPAQLQTIDAAAVCVRRNIGIARPSGRHGPECTRAWQAGLPPFTLARFPAPQAADVRHRTPASPSACLGDLRLALAAAAALPGP